MRPFGRPRRCWGNSGRATPSLRHPSSGAFSSRLSRDSRLDCRAGKICVWSRDFAYVLHLLTGWPMMAVPVLTDGAASSEDCFVRNEACFVRNPDGRLLDASGWVDETAMLARRDVLTDGFSPIVVRPRPGSQLEEFDENGREMLLKEIADVIRALPHAPFREPWFRAMTFRELPGVDVPLF